jgi:hypothetical protein
MVVATNMRYGTTQTTDILHVTGGLRGQRAIGGGLIGPLFKDGSLAAIGPVKDENFAETCRALGESVFGADDISMSDPLLPARVWQPLVGPLLLKHQPADSWSLIVPQAMDASDAEYATLARNLSMSLRAAGIGSAHRQEFGLLRNRPDARLGNEFFSAVTKVLSSIGRGRPDPLPGCSERLRDAWICEFASRPSGLNENFAFVGRSADRLYRRAGSACREACPLT